MGTLSDLWNSLDFSAMLSALMRLIAVFLCLTVHETCHGLAAYALGDPTAKREHRLSLNPLHHIDWVGLACMLVLGFGWAKPVPVDMRYFKKPKQGMALTALAGPVSNFVLALLALLCARLVYHQYGALWDFDGVSEHRSRAFQPHSDLAARRLEGTLCLPAGQRV